MRRRFFIIHNPVAGGGDSLLDPVVEGLKRAGAGVTVQSTNGPGEAESLARTAIATRECDAIVCAGGDGTINETARGLIGSGVPLGIIPLGTANVLAIEIGLGRTASTITRMLLHGEARPIVPGLANDRLFLLMAGAGFDARLVANVDLSIKSRLGKGAYALSGLLQGLRWPGSEIRIKTETREETGYWAIVSKARHYAGQFVLGPNTRLESRDFLVTLFQCASRMGLFRALVAFAQGKVFSRPDVIQFTAPSLTLSGNPGEPLQIDGDPAGELPVEITPSTEPLHLIFPQTFEE